MPSLTIKALEGCSAAGLLSLHGAVPHPCDRQRGLSGMARSSRAGALCLLSAHRALRPLPCLRRGACCCSCPRHGTQHCSQKGCSSPISWHFNFSNSLVLSEKAMISVGLQAVEQLLIIAWQALPQAVADQHIEAHLQLDLQSRQPGMHLLQRTELPRGQSLVDTMF